MANPTAEKLKVFGLRHGEKVAMGVVGVIFALCAYGAWSHPAIDVTADDVKRSAQNADQNLNKRQDEKRIEEALKGEKVEEQNFVAIVDKRQAGTVDPAKFALAQSIVIPEPDAGLIREMPELIAPTKLIVHSGRGAIRVFKLDDAGNIVYKKVADDKPRPSTKKKSAPRGGGMGARGGMGGGSTKKKSGSPKLAEQEAKKEAEAAEERKRKGIAGGDDREDMKQDEEEAEEPEGEPETVNKGYRFVTLVGKFDHKKQRELYSKALKVELAEANPHYLRLDVERQELQSDGSYSEWNKVNREKYTGLAEILNDQENEVVPVDSILTPMVDKLPYLEVGYWVGAHHGDLVPKEMLKPKTPPKATAAAKGAAGGKGGYSANMGGTNLDMSMYKSSPAPGGGNYAAGMGGGMGGMGGRAKGNGPTGGKDGDFEKSTADWLMVRVLDFDVNPDSSYRYRVRIVVANPNFGWESVAPGTDVKSKEKFGPWTAETASVGVPADVATYAMKSTPGAKVDIQGEKIQFQVVKWNPEDGLTIVKNFDQAPGQIIGANDSAFVPNDKGDGLKSKAVDFTSHQILADALGGLRSTTEIQNLGATRFEAPALALVVRADGMLVLRDQARDTNSGEMAEMNAIYERIKKDATAGSKKKGSSSMMGMYGSSMGGMSGMGGMGGVGGGGGGEDSPRGPR